MARISSCQRQAIRQRLLQTASRAFAEKGLAGADIDQIALDAELAKGTVYNYFASKEALFGAVLEEASLKTIERAPVSNPQRVNHE